MRLMRIMLAFAPAEHGVEAMPVLAGGHGVRVRVRVQQSRARVPEAAGRGAQPMSGAVASTTS